MRRLAAALIGLAFASIATNASADTFPCDNYTKTQVESMARGKPPGTHYFVDRANGIVWKYDVYRDCEEGACVKYVYQESVESQVQDYIGFIKLYSGSPVAYSENSTYDLVASPQKSEAVGSWIKGGGVGLVEDFKNFLATLNPIPNFNPGAADFTLRVIMPDGGSALYVYDHTLQTWTRVPNQTRDSNGNVIPEAPVDVAPVGGYRNYDFTGHPENFGGFWTRMDLFDIPISSGSGKQVRCAASIVGGESRVTCYIF